MGGGNLFTIRSSFSFVNGASVLSRNLHAHFRVLDHTGGTVKSLYRKPIRGLLAASVCSVIALASTPGLNAEELKAENEGESCVWSTNFTVGDLDGGVWDLSLIHI